MSIPFLPRSLYQVAYHLGLIVANTSLLASAWYVFGRKRTAVRRTRLFVFFGARPRRFFISENDDFELPASQSNFARRPT